MARPLVAACRRSGADVVAFGCRHSAQGAGTTRAPQAQRTHGAVWLGCALAPVGHAALRSPGPLAPRLFVHPLVLCIAPQVLGTALGLPVAAGLLVLLVWNFYLASRNQTTIEYHEGRPVGQLAQAGRGWPHCVAGMHAGHTGHAGGIQSVAGDLTGQQYPAPPFGAGVVARHMGAAPASGSGPGVHLFDLGLHDNAVAMCGDNAACWLLPGRPAAQGDGLAFPSRWDAASVKPGGGAGA